MSKSDDKRKGSQGVSARSASKREELRAKRQQRERTQRITIIAVVAVVAIVIAALLIAPSLQPVGDVIVPTQLPRPHAEGLSMGNPNAPVKVVEYADYQCPGCGNFAKNLEPQIVEAYIKTGKVFFTYHPFSFIDDNRGGRESKAPAEASYCAADQNKFWEYHDIVYANQAGENLGAFTDKRLIAFAEAINLDMNAFESCFNSGKYKDQVLKDKSEAIDAGINQTPTFDVNGEKVSANDLLTAIEAAYQKLN
jgi:protein-disulfide isomerase